ncbi:hypothetical protein V6N00_13280 [Tersicoccus sp. MR15.9]|uniref:hypothetical protein n=1 Tax=Tersicoccus mangrovi TaxID=3121635 RepID=UPI002FE686E6
MSRSRKRTGDLSVLDCISCSSGIADESGAHTVCALCALAAEEQAPATVTVLPATLISPVEAVQGWAA